MSSDFFGDQNPHDFLTPGEESPEKIREPEVKAPQPWPTPLSRQDSISLLQRALGLAKEQTTTIQDNPTVFISVNLGHSAATLEPKDIFEVGLAILDTRNISSESPKKRGFPIRTHNFTISSTKGDVETSTPFAFGPSAKISPKKLDTLFQRIAWGPKHEKPLYQTNSAKVVLLGKNIAANLRMMDQVVPGVWSSVTVEAIVDVCNLTEQECFFILLEELDIRPQLGDRCLFCAGNDANYALRASLLYTCYTVDSGRDTTPPQVEENLGLVASVSLHGIPNGIELSCSHNTNARPLTTVGKWRRGKCEKLLGERGADRGKSKLQYDGTGYMEVLGLMMREFL
ncbi:hypothetical protein IFR05_001441 [Cadophora sp. M221]|nr:hypothetical protein IFR05_001441 [Cadophora sp. M221]